MSLLRHDQCLRACWATAGSLVVALLLPGCSGTSGPGASEGAPSTTSRFLSFFGSSRVAGPPVAPGEPVAADVECPAVEIRRGAGTLNVAARSGDATAGDLRYQLSLRQTARECLVQAGNLTVRVGVQGRIILGPYGVPGPVDIPLRYAVVQEGAQPRTIITKFKRFTAPVHPGDTNVEFTDIEDSLTFPLPTPLELAAYQVYVGFDEIGDRNERKPPPKTAKKKAAQ